MLLWISSNSCPLNLLLVRSHQADMVMIRQGVSDNPMLLWISSNSCPLNLLLVRSHQADMVMIRRLIQGRNNVTRVRVEPRSRWSLKQRLYLFGHAAELEETFRREFYGRNRYFSRFMPWFVGAVLVFKSSQDCISTFTDFSQNHKNILC